MKFVFKVTGIEPKHQKPCTYTCTDKLTDPSDQTSKLDEQCPPAFE